MKRKLLSAALLLSHQSCPTLCDPRDGRQPTRLPHPWDSPGKNTGVGCHFLLQCVKVKLLSRVRLFATPWTAAHQAPLSMGFSRQEYWSGVPLPSPIAFYSSTIWVIYAHYSRWFLSPESGVVGIFLLKNCVFWGYKTSWLSEHCWNK